MGRLEVIQQRKIIPRDFLGKRYTPSILIRGAFLKLFKSVYPNFSDEFIIKNLAFDQYTFRFTFTLKDSQEEYQINIQDNKKEYVCKGQYCSKNICNGIHYSLDNKNVTRFLLYLSNKGENITFDSFLEILATDPKAKKEYYQIFWKAKRPPFSIIQDWGHDTHKFRFITPEGVLRNIDQSLELNISEGHIHHSERECRAVGPEVEHHKEIHFFSYPWGFYDHTFDKYFYLEEQERKKMLQREKSGFGIFTDLSEDDIVMGKGNEILSRTLDTLIEKIDTEKLQSLTFNCCCVPRIVGDDIQSLLQKAKEKSSIPFIFTGQLEKTPFEQKISLLEDYLAKIDNSTYKIQKKSITLLGYHENTYLESIYMILKQNNIKLNAIFIPNIDLELLPKLYETELFVFSNNKFQEEIFEYPFKNIAKNFISPDYPYSVEKTKIWLSEIVGFFNQKYIISPEEESILSEYEKQVQYVREKKYKVSLLFLGKSQIEDFFNPDYNNNIDIIYFLEEMGFGIQFLVYNNLQEYSVVNNEIRFDEEDRDENAITKIIYEKVKNKDTTTIHIISSEEEMEQYVKATQLIYSDIYFEDRFYNYGINIFNLRYFKEGYVGALDTIKSLIKLIEINYYTNFGKYFKREHDKTR